jgi:hypothetical protein
VSRNRLADTSRSDKQLKLTAALLSPLEHPIDAWYNLERNGRATWILLALFVLAWTTFQTLEFPIGQAF